HILCRSSVLVRPRPPVALTPASTEEDVLLTDPDLATARGPTENARVPPLPLQRGASPNGSPECPSELQLPTDQILKEMARDMSTSSAAPRPCRNEPVHPWTPAPACATVTSCTVAPGSTHEPAPRHRPHRARRRRRLRGRRWEGCV